MTPEEQTTFIKAAQMGVACGLSHRYEWYVNAQRAIGHGAYSEIIPALDALLRAFLAFEKGTGCCPEESEELSQLTDDGFSELVINFYAQARK